MSQADLLAGGSLRIEQPFVQTMPWPFAEWTFAPAGYRPGKVPGFIVPAYPPGLPFVMSLFQRVSGPAAVFYVVPLLGALAVWMTARLGAGVYGPMAGIVAAVWLAASPAFLYQVVQPLSDVPVTAWWTVSLALAVRAGAGSALGAGLAASMAVVTRPNLVPLAAVIGGFLVWRARRTEAGGRRAAVRPLAWFAAGVLPGCLAVAAINQYLYGSALRSGYEDFSALYAWTNLGPNLDRYPRWLVQTQSPVIGLALVAPWVLGRRGTSAGESRVAPEHVWLLLAFAGAVFVSYVLYVPYGRDEWGYVRFLLPAFPALMVLGSGVVAEMLRRAIGRRPAEVAASFALAAALIVWQARESVNRGAFLTERAERRYADVGRYVANATPREAVVIAGLHAGSIRYYSGRLTLRYDWLEPRWLDEAVRALAANGYHPYIVLEEGEEAGFRERFGALNRLARLDWQPLARRSQPIRVKIFDPADRERFPAGQTPTPADIPPVRRPPFASR